MSAKLHFLGTGGMLPTKDRNPLSVAFEFKGELFLFDCAEGTQRQIKIMKLHIGKINKIFISHWHGDHTLGLGGLIQTLSNTDNIERIEIHGPLNTKYYIENILKSSIFDTKIKIDVYEHNPKQNETLLIIENSNYTISCAKLKHSTPCLGYSFKEKDVLNIDKAKLKKIAPEIEKSPMLARAKMGYDIKHIDKTIKAEDITYKKEGLKVSFIFDTRPCPEIDLLSDNADYLVIESNHLHSKHAEKAEEYEHMTAKEAAEVALQNNVKNMIITHFSQRYKDITPLLEEAQEIFENTTATQDLMTIKLK